ncbi:hypothetical protein RB195_016472 [Necator americanus]|uniref:Uncharacterized protein n=1 Tax=Necator americanus TaxID=51031 RepID=A0ABR1C0M1_NECAM
MNGVAALKQRQQPGPSTADWARAPLRSELSSAGLFTSHAEALTSKTSPGRETPTLSKTPPFSTLSKRIRRSTPTVLRRDSGVAVQQMSVASRLSAAEKCWLDGSLTPLLL